MHRLDCTGLWATALVLIAIGGSNAGAEGSPPVGWPAYGGGAGLRYSPLDSLELSLGVQLFAGPKLSQYGSSEPLVFLLADWFF